MIADDAVDDFETIIRRTLLAPKGTLSSHIIRSLMLICTFSSNLLLWVPPSNDIDVSADDVGFITIMDEKGGLAGIHVTTGGEMGVTHENKKTCSRTTNGPGFYTVEQGKRRGEDYVGPTRPWQYVFDQNSLQGRAP